MLVSIRGLPKETVPLLAFLRDAENWILHPTESGTQVRRNAELLSINPLRARYLGLR